MFKQKYNTSFTDMGDGHVFDKHKDIKSIDTEFSEILDKITDLREKIPEEYDAKQTTLDGAYKIRDELKVRKKTYSTGIGTPNTARSDTLPLETQKIVPEN